jgi:hypothetical protein
VSALGLREDSLVGPQRPPPLCNRPVGEYAASKAVNPGKD